ncbi:hypothetical protein PS1_030560 [Malus domestica]
MKKLQRKRNRRRGTLKLKDIDYEHSEENDEGGVDKEPGQISNEEYNSKDFTIGLNHMRMKPIGGLSCLNIEDRHN